MLDELVKVCKIYEVVKAVCRGTTVKYRPLTITQRRAGISSFCQHFKMPVTYVLHVYIRRFQ